MDEMVNVIKIDYDDKSIVKYIDTWKRSYIQLLRIWNVDEICIKQTKVYQTKKGLHIYIYLQTNYHYNEILLLECLLGSDINKQLYSYIEWSDILFKRKNSISEKFDANQTKILIKFFIDEVKKQYFLKIYDIVDDGVLTTGDIIYLKEKIEEVYKDGIYGKGKS